MNLFTFRTTTHPTTPAGIGRSNVMPTTKRRALILISSGRQLPLVEPAEVKSISTGFFLVEMAQVLKEFENDYEFTFATPDGNAPQLDINGMALSVQSIEKTGFKTLPMRMQQRRRSFDVSSFRARHPELVARREQEVRLLERHIGGIPSPDPGLRTPAQQRTGARRVPPRTDPPPRQAAQWHLPLAAGTRRAPPRPGRPVHLRRLRRHPRPRRSRPDGRLPRRPVARRNPPPGPGERRHHLADLPRAPGDDLHPAARRRAWPLLPRQRQPVPRRHHLGRPQDRRAVRDAVRLPPRPRQDDPSPLLRRRGHQGSWLHRHIP